MANVFEIISRCCIMMTCLVKIDLVIGVFFEELLSSASSQHYQDGTATMIRKYLHRCDMSSDCNFLLLDTTKDQFTMVKSESEMPVNRISLRIWKKLQIIGKLRLSILFIVHKVGTHTIYIFLSNTTQYIMVRIFHEVRCLSSS